MAASNGHAVVVVENEAAGAGIGAGADVGAVGDPPVVEGAAASPARGCGGLGIPEPKKWVTALNCSGRMNSATQSTIHSTISG